MLLNLVTPETSEIQNVIGTILLLVKTLIVLRNREFANLKFEILNLRAQPCSKEVFSTNFISSIQPSTDDQYICNEDTEMTPYRNRSIDWQFDIKSNDWFLYEFVLIFLLLALNLFQTFLLCSYFLLWIWGLWA